MKVRNFVWAMPICFVIFSTAVILTLQSCSVPIHMENEEEIIRLKDLYWPGALVIIIALCGSALSLLNYFDMQRIKKALKERGLDI